MPIYRVLLNVVVPFGMVTRADDEAEAIRIAKEQAREILPPDLRASATVGVAGVRRFRGGPAPRPSPGTSWEGLCRVVLHELGEGGPLSRNALETLHGPSMGHPIVREVVVRLLASGAAVLNPEGLVDIPPPSGPETHTEALERAFPGDGG